MDQKKDNLKTIQNWYFHILIKSQIFEQSKVQQFEQMNFLMNS